MWSWVERIHSRLRRSIKLRKLIMTIGSWLPLRNEVVLSSHEGKYFSDSPLAIFEELRARRPKWRYTWLSQDTEARLEGAKTVDFNSPWAAWHLARSRVWVDNVRKPIWVRKRPGQYYVQTWHSGITNKSGEGDEEAKINKSYMRRAMHDSTLADLFVSGSAWQTQHYRRAFWYDGEILESGLPRTDLFFQPAGTVRARVRSWFGLDAGVRLAIYAPTFRDAKALAVYDLDCHALLQTLSRRFGGTWKLLLRLHPELAKSHGDCSYDDAVLDATTYPDINELIVAAEWLITDYSSCAFDALEAGKRVAAYVPDLEAYAQERGFYFQPAELPYRQFRTNAALLEYLSNFDEKTFERARVDFLKRCGLFDDGHASARVVDRILEVVEK